MVKIARSIDLTKPQLSPSYIIAMIIIVVILLAVWTLGSWLFGKARGFVSPVVEKAEPEGF